MESLWPDIDASATLFVRAFEHEMARRARQKSLAQLGDKLMRKQVANQTDRQTDRRPGRQGEWTRSSFTPAAPRASGPRSTRQENAEAELPHSWHLRIARLNCKPSAIRRRASPISSLLVAWRDRKRFAPSHQTTGPCRATGPCRPTWSRGFSHPSVARDFILHLAA